MTQKIYTKTGDNGTTSLIGGTKVSKNNLRIETYGTIDELNSFIGLIIDSISDAYTKTILIDIQDRLFTIGAALACDPDKEPMLKLPDLKETDIVLLEDEMDTMNTILPLMKSFILPSGHTTISTIHIGRCVCRRAERLCVRMQENQLYIAPLIIKYINRLSDYLFVLARYIGHLLDIPEVVWRPRIS